MNCIDRIDKCYGCGACKQICPVEAVEIVQDKDGFYCAVADKNKCINCSKCIDVCPRLNVSYVNYDKPLCFAAMANDKIRVESSSGGIFALAAEFILQKSGCVVGAAWQENFNVAHRVIWDKNEIDKIKRSKYVQSNILNTYKETKEALENEKYVLYTGCPCQIAGLYSFLGKKYEKLYTIDLLCHGVPSSKVLRKYLEDTYGIKNIRSVKFRDKPYFGWTGGMSIELVNGEINRIPVNKDAWYQAFLKLISLNSICESCQFSKLPRQGDITLGDFWNIERYDEKLNDRKGTSLVLVNNNKGNELFNSLKGMQRKERIPMSFVKTTCNQIIFRPFIHHINRDVFFKKINTKKFDKVVFDCLKGNVETMYECYILDRTSRSFKGNEIECLIYEIVKQAIKEKMEICIPLFKGDKIHFEFILNELELNRFIYPIYVKTEVEECIQEIEKRLYNHKKILFLGLPCQVTKLLNMVKNNRDLLTISLGCEGATSNNIFADSLKNLKDGKEITRLNYECNRKKSGKKISSIQYRDGVIKEFGLGKRYLLEDGIYEQIILTDECYECSSKNIVLNGDMFINWCVQDEKKSSQAFVVLNTEIGKAFFEKCKELQDILYMESKSEIAVNNISQKSSVRDHFKHLYAHRQFDEAMQMALNKQFDIGIASGYATTNYGGALTQYAMYQILKDRGYSVYLIERPLNGNNRGDYRSKFLENLPYQKYELAPNYYSTDDMVEVNKRCKMFLSGSDQFFNTYLWEETKQFFSLKWVYDYKPKISYASSFGFDYLWDTEEQLAERKYYLKRFNKLSVREKSAVDLVKKELDIYAEWVLDPIFLCDIVHYQEIAKQYDNSEKYSGRYLFAYILNPTQEKEKILRKIADYKELELIVFSDVECLGKKYSENWNLGISFNVDLAEWLYALEHSEFVVTDSFHGTCFALIYGKNYISIINRQRGMARFESLGDLFDIKNRMIETVEELGEEQLRNIDYSMIQSTMESEKKRCNKWLDDAIKEAMEIQSEMTEYDFLLNNKQLSKQNLCYFYSNIGELGLKEGCSIEEIIRKMPCNSSIHQVQGAMGKPIIDTPVPYGVLEIYKTTNYFVKILFYQMTIEDSLPQIYQGKVKEQKVVMWEKYVPYSEYSMLDKKIQNLEKDVNFLIRHYAETLND